MMAAPCSVKSDEQSLLLEVHRILPKIRVDILPLWTMQQQQQAGVRPRLHLSLLQPHSSGLHPSIHPLLAPSASFLARASPTAPAMGYSSRNPGHCNPIKSNQTHSLWSCSTATTSSLQLPGSRDRLCVCDCEHFFLPLRC